MAKKNFYAVRVGRKNGIFLSWSECEQYVKGFKGADFQGFTTLPEAELYLNREKIPQKHKKQKHYSAPIENNHKMNARMLHVYVDGSYNNEKKVAGYGLVIVQGNQVVMKDFSSYPYEEVIVSHNVGAELKGSQRAVELAIANDFKELMIYYDYEGIEKFATGEWKAKTTQTIEYHRMMEKYQKHIRIRFSKVKAHSGERFNDIADKLAKLATKM
ncbi:ribonuclease H family protein (plasmid) [Aneurinibacillus sp. Ricciae_BoGa-3]|uniref:ribonuclease H family protein n=1 Tax=Aneurinibacillus sp. Ricciae_BoGa-3 TaxID=3022697 RepID=UPI0023422B08|nr:ribonuclease H family protein [Aneurinibacillus sp. Ricciae_BoGa-3]WCK57155.1 ribonuclease H family protein [Aneurinibacillus sp. Ricciae_BoGa-3]